MIVDIHTHLFPPEFIAGRARIAEREPVFAEMYGDPRARMATADDLLASMDAGGADISVACGFWWDDAGLAREHSAYLLDAAAASDGRILAFTPAPAEGAAGLGEVRETEPSKFPDTPLPVLAHCTEEVGHLYPGKAGGLTPGGLWQVLLARPQARLIAAHLGGGFPFFALMPEVREVIEADRVIFDTAAASLLYRRDEPAQVYRALVALVGARHLAWGSDFPLRAQTPDREALAAALADDGERAAVLGGNAARFLGIAPAEG